MSVTVFEDIDRHDARTFTATFVIPGGDPANPTDRRDPSDVYHAIRTPAGVETEIHYNNPGGAALTKASTGVYQYTVTDFSEELSWWGRFRGTGSFAAVVVYEARVRTDVFTT
jgi:hypothetical protein